MTANFDTASREKWQCSPKNIYHSENGQPPPSSSGGSTLPTSLCLQWRQLYRRTGIVQCTADRAERVWEIAIYIYIYIYILWDIFFAGCGQLFTFLKKEAGTSASELPSSSFLEPLITEILTFFEYTRSGEANNERNVVAHLCFLR